jgi:CBS domain-containing protein
MGTIAANSNNPKTGVSVLRDIVSQRHSPSLFETDYVRVVLPILQDGDFGAAGVLDDQGRLCGLVTERSILRKMFARTSEKLIHASNVKKYLDDMTIAEVMIPHPETLDEDISIEDAAGMMLRRGYRYMPVVSRFDRTQLLGIVSERELALQLQQQLREVKKAEKVQRSILSYMLWEPYGSGPQSAEA